MICPDLEKLLQKYAKAETEDELYIKRTLEDIAFQFEVSDREQHYYADVVTRAFCRIIKVLEKQPETEANEKHSLRFGTGEELARAFYNHYRQGEQVDYLELPWALESGRKDLINPTMKDYVARIYTFSGKKYLGEMFSRQQIGNQDPVLFVYDNIELILATFKTRDDRGEIVKQRVNIRSALRKLNEFKQRTEQR